MVEPDWKFLLSEQVRLNSRHFYQLARAIVRDDDLAQDVCQQAFTLAWEHRSKLDPSGTTLKSWISSTVWTLGLQRVRRMKIERRALGQHAARQPDQIADPRPGEDLRDSIATALARLPEPGRTMIKLKFLEGKASREICVIFKCSKSDLWRQMQSALELLRGWLSADWRPDRHP